MGNGIRARKALLDRIVAMLTKLGRRGCTVNENQAQYTVGINTDPDTDTDAEGKAANGDRRIMFPGPGPAARDSPRRVGAIGKRCPPEADHRTPKDAAHQYYRAKRPGVRAACRRFPFIGPRPDAALTAYQWLRRWLGLDDLMTA